MLKYLDKVKVVSETAGHGQECLDMVFSHEPGYYSLIIVGPISLFDCLMLMLIAVAV
jgi:hypothetical protein